MEALRVKLLWVANNLWMQDRLKYWERLRPLSIYFSKAAEAFVVSQIAEVYLSINNFDKAYSFGIEALKLAREAEQSAPQAFALMTVSGSLIGLGRFQEAENLLQEFLPKVRNEPESEAIILGQLGLVYSTLGREKEMIIVFQDAIDIARSSGMKDLEAITEFKFGLSYIILKKHREAIQELTAALQLYKKSENELKVALIESSIANTYFVAGLFEEANKYALHAAELFHKLGNRAEEVKHLLIAGDSLTALNKVEEATRVLEKAIYIQVEAKDRNGALWTFGIIINLMKKEGWFEEAKRALLTGLEKYTSVFGDKEGEAQIRIELSNIYHELGLFSKELEQLGEVLSINRQLNNLRGEIFTLLKMSGAYAALNDYEYRSYVLGLAEKLGSELDDPVVKLNILGDSALFFQDIGDITEALQRHLEALKISRMIGKQAEILQLVFIGHFFTVIGEYTKAISYFEEGLKLAKEMGDRINMASHLKGIGFCYIVMNRYRDAIQVLQEALDIHKALKTRSDEYFILELIAFALVEQGNYETALQALQECLKFSIESGSTKRLADIYGRIGYAYLRMGKYREGIETYKEAIEWIEYLKGQILDEEQVVSYFAKQLSPYDGIVEAFYNLFLKEGSKIQLAAEALNFAEQSKARVWATQLSQARANFIQGSIPEEILIEERELAKQTIRIYNDYLYTTSRYGIPKEEIERKMKTWESALEKTNSFTEKIRKQYPNYALLRYGLPSFTLKELALRDGETLVIYKLSSDYTYVWSVKKNNNENEIVKFIRLPTVTAEIEKNVVKLLMPFEKVKYEEFNRNLASDLFDKILKPVLDEVDVSNHLLIVPDGILNIVPFEMLVTKNGCNNDVKNTCFLGDQDVISYYPSVTILTYNRQVTSQSLPPQGSIFAVGDPIYEPNDERLNQSQISMLTESEQNEHETNVALRSGKVRGAQEQGYSFTRLRHSGTEIRKIRDIFENSLGNREILDGVEACEGSIKSKDLTQYRYIHFAVHGILAYEVPYLKEPALVLSLYPQETKEDGFLTLTEVYRLKFNTDLITLSACKTGLGLRVAGEGVVGLSRAFMNAGSRAVLVSLWEVADESTSLFMEDFYRLLSQGMNKVEALAKAKQNLRQKGYENPFFWAPFVLIGD